MGKDTKIGWANATFNPWIGCTKISAGCANCYAKTQQEDKYHRAEWGKDKPRYKTKDWTGPEKWDREAAQLGIRYRVFCASLADVFDEEVSDDWRNELFDLIRKTPNLDWLVLTKRVQKAKDYLPTVQGWPFSNVWLGASVENQEAVDYRIPILIDIPAIIKFVSVEPLIQPVNLFGFLQWLQWVIVGGESGEGFRTMKPDWAMSVFSQCQTAKVAFYMKQGSGLLPETQGDISKGLWDVKEFPR